MSATETPASQSVDQVSPTVPNSPSTQLPPSPTKSVYSSTTHITQVQPHSSFFRVSHPNEVRPRSSSFVSTTASPQQNRYLDASHVPSLNRQLSIASASDGSSIAARRIKHSREPLLPIGGAIPKRLGNLATGTPSSPSGNSNKMRNSLEKIFKRGNSVDSLPTSPTKASPRPSPLQARFTPADLELRPPRSPGAGNSGDFPSQALPRQSSNASLSPSSHHPGFSAMPPAEAAPFVPYISSKTGKPLRNYEDYPSRNTFFLRGRLLTGGDSPLPFILSFSLVLGMSGTWFGTTCVWWWKNESPAVAAVGAYMCLLSISSMLATALRDPGILPRDLDPDPPYPTVSPASDGRSPEPYPRDLQIGESVVRVKYCVTCNTYRPPRSSHCKACDNCIDGCDHHCQWVNNCVGRRNYTSFITFLVTSNLTLVLIIVTSILNLIILMRRDKISFRMALGASPGSAVVFFLGIAIICPLLVLMGYHVRLLLLNITTIEQVRSKVHASLIPGPEPPNPFSLGRWYRNVAYLLCRPAGYSWIEASAVKMEDRRKINPGAYEDWDEQEDA